MLRRTSLICLLLLICSGLNASLFGEAIKISINADGTDIREEPDQSAKVITIAQKGELFRFVHNKDGWTKIELSPNNSAGENASNLPIFGFIRTSETTPIFAKKLTTNEEKKKKNSVFLMGMGMMRLNWANVEGNELRFRSSDLGLPTDFSTRERASFMLDGELQDGEYDISGHLNYDPENRITEPALDFFLTVGNDHKRISVGDNRSGVFLDSMFTRYAHPFRGASAELNTQIAGIELIGGYARGEAGFEEIPTDIGAGPYTLQEAPIIRGSEVLYLVVKSRANPDLEIKRTRMVRNSDYYIDYDRGDIIFSYPIYPTDDVGNPQFIVTNYQYESLSGSFTRGVLGFKAFYKPIEQFKLNLSYLADFDKNINFSDAIDDRRGILSLGFEFNSKKVTAFTEFATNDERNVDTQRALFGGAVVTFSDKLKLYANTWQVDKDFPTFANQQLEYGFNLFQIYPIFSQRSIFLSPFQFSRNLGTQLFPFTLLGLSIDEKETNGFIEWDDGDNIINSGYGTKRGIVDELNNDTYYLSFFRDKEKYQLWGKIQGDHHFDRQKQQSDIQTTSILTGWRQQLVSNSNGGLFIQLDLSREDTDDILEIQQDTFRQNASISIELLKESEGVFAAYRKDRLEEKHGGGLISDVDIFEVGIKYHFYKNYFIDSRYRKEQGIRNGVNSDPSILSLGAGYEGERFRGIGRYELQLNDSDQGTGRRELWSLFLFGNPIEKMSLSLKYYKQIGHDEDPFSITEHSEEQLSFRLLYKPTNALSLYSQWRYDLNAELYPPLDNIESNSLASIQGLKYRISSKFEFLANYKLLKIWGPIENKKETYAAELGYLFHKHFRLGVGFESDTFEDKFNNDNDYNSNTGYFKLVAIF